MLHLAPALISFSCKNFVKFGKQQIFSLSLMKNLQLKKYCFFLRSNINFRNLLLLEIGQLLFQGFT